MLIRELILLPAVALVMLTAIVWLVLFSTRMSEMRERRLRPQTAFATRAQASSTLTAAGPSDNFMNLFELPVLFYVLILTLYVAHLADMPHLVLAWLYVALRALHSFIHVTYNRVVHRFYVFAMSSVVLWIMWGRLALQLIERIADGTI